MLLFQPKLSAKHRVADVNGRGRGLRTPVGIAAAHSTVAIMTFLIRHGADVNATSEDHNNALHELLLGEGCDFDDKLAFLLRLPQLEFSAVNGNNLTAADIARQQQRPDVAKQIDDKVRGARRHSCFSSVVPRACLWLLWSLAAWSGRCVEAGGRVEGYAGRHRQLPLGKHKVCATTVPVIVSAAAVHACSLVGRT